MDKERDMCLKTAIEIFFKTNESYTGRRSPEIVLFNDKNRKSLSCVYQNLLTNKD